MNKTFIIFVISIVYFPFVLAQNAQDLYDKAIAGDGFAQVRLGVQYLLSHDDDQAIYWINKSLEQNNPQAQYIMGDIKIEKQKYEEAFHWYEKSALQDWDQGCYGLGMCYLNGEGTTRDLILAKKWFEKAVELGHEESSKKLNLVKLEIKENEPFADKEVDDAYNQFLSKDQTIRNKGWNRLVALAEKGHGKAYGYMGTHLLRKDTQIKIDDVKLGLKCFLQGVELDDVISISEVGSYYSEGLTINGQCILEKNIPLAKRLLEMAASRNFHPACYNLGELYHREGNKDTAEKWYLKAGAMGNVMAMYNLAMLYLNDGLTTKAYQLVRLAE